MYLIPIDAQERLFTIAPERKADLARRDARARPLKNLPVIQAHACQNFTNKSLGPAVCVFPPTLVCRSDYPPAVGVRRKPTYSDNIDIPFNKGTANCNLGSPITATDNAAIAASNHGAPALKQSMLLEEVDRIESDRMA